MGNPEVTYELRGHYAGRTVALGGYEFVDGLHVTSAYTEEQHELLARHLSQWGGFRVDGKRYAAEAGPRAVVGEGGSEGAGTAPGGQAAQGEGSPAGDPVGQGRRVVSEGDRPEPQLDPAGERLRRAVLALDHDSDDDWTTSGRPALSAVERIAGFGGITRAKVEAVAPGFKRSKT